MELSEVLNSTYIDQQYRLWKRQKDSVSQDWQLFFQGFEMARHDGSGSPGEGFDTTRQSRVDRLVRRYREVGHLMACLDPLTACPMSHPLLDLSAVGLTEDALGEVVNSDVVGHSQPTPIQDIIATLRQTYCRSIGVEFMHLQDPHERQWLQARLEANAGQPDQTAQDQQQALKLLTQATLFEQFLHRKYIGQTRFSLEGAEGVVVFLDQVVEQMARLGGREIILGMAHRGRLNVQAHVLQKSYVEIFHEFENCFDPESIYGAGDVKYHNGYLADLKTRTGSAMRMFLVNNPSHLESVDPVVEGVAKARQVQIGADAFKAVLPLLIHGDAAFAGQGVVAETLNLSQLKGYRTGGTVHLIINNQIGYTTLPEDARSTRYSTDIAKMLMVPIFHVHGEDVAALMKIARLACDYRAEFAKDVVVDILCYRKFGHNEGDEPYFTQPQMYARIKSRQPLLAQYRKQLVEQQVVTPETADQMQATVKSILESAYEQAHDGTCVLPEERRFKVWQGFSHRYDFEPLETRVAADRLTEIARRLTQVPEGFDVHPKIAALLQKRLEAITPDGQRIDWANAEALALGTLLTEKTGIRLSGQDSGRGTFSQRHSVLVDRESGDTWTPLNGLGNGQAFFDVCNSPLSEAGVLGFDYGFAMVAPRELVLWEAQFGDFANNAQSVIDLYIASGESKWRLMNGLVLLLPHGMEGLGPEHSSARLERFLQLCADNNLQVCNLTTPAQYFHLLRRQVKAPFRKPLVVMTPKSLLRHPLAVSALADLSEGRFEPVLDDAAQFKGAQRLLFCSGKIYYELLQRRIANERQDTALIRIEQLYPLHETRLAQILKSYKNVKNCIWVQEEPQNMGAWQFIKSRLEALTMAPLDYIGRPRGSSPATGYPHIYRRDQAAIVAKAMGEQPGAEKTA